MSSVGECGFDVVVERCYSRGTAIVRERRRRGTLAVGSWKPLSSNATQDATVDKGTVKRSHVLHVTDSRKSHANRNPVYITP
jgi:hypothetical protein